MIMEIITKNYKNPKKAENPKENPKSSEVNNT